MTIACKSTQTQVRVLLRVSLLSGTQSGGGASSAEGLGASTRRLQRWLLILAPILVVFPPPKDVAEEHLVDWLGKLVAADEVVPTSSSVRALARDVGRQVRSADPAFSDSISALWRKGEMAGGGGGGAGGEGEDEGIARLIEGWLQSGLSGYVSIEALVLSWDQCFIGGWHLLPRACGRLILKLKDELLRATGAGWQQCVSIMTTSPLKFAPETVLECFAD